MYTCIYKHISFTTFDGHTHIDVVQYIYIYTDVHVCLFIHMYVYVNMWYFHFQTKISRTTNMETGAELPREEEKSLSDASAFEFDSNHPKVCLVVVVNPCEENVEAATQTMPSGDSPAHVQLLETVGGLHKLSKPNAGPEQLQAFGRGELPDKKHRTAGSLSDLIATCMPRIQAHPPTV